MAAFVLTEASTIQCTHGGTATVTSSNSSVKADGSAILVEDDKHQVAGCSFMKGNTPSPCTTIEWSSPATKVKINNKAVLLQTSTGQCKASGATQGTAIIANTQTKVKAT
jgi:hypothetical protein